MANGLLDGDERRDLIGIGASAGRVEALTRPLPTLSRELAAAIAVVLHLGPGSASSLTALLARCGPLDAEYARDGVELHRGGVYVAPPDRHLALERNRLLVIRGPRQNQVRPAIDPFFRISGPLSSRSF